MPVSVDYSGMPQHCSMYCSYVKPKIESPATNVLRGTFFLADRIASGPPLLPHLVWRQEEAARLPVRFMLTRSHVSDQAQVRLPALAQASTEHPQRSLRIVFGEDLASVRRARPFSVDAVMRTAIPFQARQVPPIQPDREQGRQRCRMSHRAPILRRTRQTPRHVTRIQHPGRRVRGAAPRAHLRRPSACASGNRKRV